MGDWELHLSDCAPHEEVLADLLATWSRERDLSSGTVNARFSTAPPPTLIDAVGSWLFNLGVPHTQIQTRRPDAPWEPGWRAFFEAHEVLPGLWIRPPWSPQPAAPEAHVLTIDPAKAFGTGCHPTTVGSLHFLRGLIRPGMTLLDVGSGSGILSIAAARLGAQGLGIETDGQALEAAASNAAANGVSQQLSWSDATLDTLSDSYDVVVVNIFASVVIRLAAEVKRLARQHVLVSGLQLSEEDAVCAAYLPLRCQQRWTRDSWLTLHFSGD